MHCSRRSLVKRNQSMSSPPHTSEPSARRLNGNVVVGQEAWWLGTRGSFPSIEPEPRARRIDARQATEVLSMPAIPRERATLSVASTIRWTWSICTENCTTRNHSRHVRARAWRSATKIVCLRRLGKRRAAPRAVSREPGAARHAPGARGEGRCPARLAACGRRCDGRHPTFGNSARTDVGASVRANAVRL